MPVLTPEQYRQRAAQVYDPSYAVKVANEQNAYNNALNSYNNQGNMIENNFQKQVADINRSTTQTQNQFNNNTLSRGMARSSVATTGLAGIGNTGTRLQAEADATKTQDLNNLEQLKTTLRQNLDSTLNALSTEHEGGINSLALQLQQRDEDIARSSRSSGGGGGGSKTSSKDLYSSALSALQQVMQQRGNGNQFIRDFEPQWAAQGMTTAQINALKKYVEDYFYTPDETLQYHKKTYNQRPATEGL